MRIRWDPVQVMDAADQLEGQVKQIMKPLEQAKAAAEKAREIPHLPDYVKYRFNSFIYEVERAIGKKSIPGPGDYCYSGTLQSRISDIRKDVPQDALAEAKAQPALLKIGM